jgi:hypothetical protein
VVADLLASDSVLLVSEGKCGPHEAAYIHVIQRWVSGADMAVGGVKVDVAEPEGLGPAVGRAEEVLGRAKHPEETNDGEVDGLLEGPDVREGYAEGQGVHVVEDGGVGRVCPL